LRKHQQKIKAKDTSESQFENKKSISQFLTLQAVGYAKRERNHCKQPSAFSSSK